MPPTDSPPMSSPPPPASCWRVRRSAAGRTSIARWPPRRRRSTTRAAGRPGRQPRAGAPPQNPPTRTKQTPKDPPQLETRNVGKPISGARGEALGVSLVFEYYAGAANKVFGETIPVSKPGLDFTLREPIGGGR